MNTHPLGEVLVPVDGFGPSTNAAWRAALVARDLGAPLRLLHVQEGVRAGAASEAALRRLALEIGERTGVTPQLDIVAGKGTPENVLAGATASASRTGPFYAHLYLGLYYEVQDNQVKAQQHIDRAVMLAGEDYMGDVARVHQTLLRTRKQ